MGWLVCVAAWAWTAVAWSGGLTDEPGECTLGVEGFCGSGCSANLVATYEDYCRLMDDQLPVKCCDGVCIKVTCDDSTPGCPNTTGFWWAHSGQGKGLEGYNCSAPWPPSPSICKAKVPHKCAGQ